MNDRDRPWMMRTYSGHSTARASNELYRTNLSKGQTGLSIAFDLPTQTGYDPDDPGEPGRGQVGIEWERGTRWGPYGALDVQAWQERDWARDVAVQGGIAFRSETRRWRLGIEAYDGRVPLGEFFLEDQRHVAVGLFLDLGEGVLAP